METDPKRKGFLSLDGEDRTEDPAYTSMEEIHSTPIQNIDQELRRLWSTQQGDGSARACLFNLIVYTQECSRSEYFESLASLVVKQYPCRIIYIKSNPNPDADYLRSSVSVEIIGDGNQKVGCDKITIEVSNSQQRRVPFLVLPHIVPDLPIYFMWGQDPTIEDQILPHLERFATRLVFDPESTNDLHRFSKEILHKIDKTGAEVLDLIWARSNGWRDLMAKVFADPEEIKRLRGCSQVDIVYNCQSERTSKHRHLQALYLQAWLAAQLGWKYTGRELEGDRQSYHYRGIEDMITVTLMGREVPELPSGSLLQVDIHTCNGYHTQLQRQGESRQVRVIRSSPSACELPYFVAISLLNRQHSLLRDVFYERMGGHYQNMLQALTPILQP